MLCEICEKNEANFHIAKIINGVKEEKHVCEQCAKTLEGINLLSDMNFSTDFSFQNILSGFLDYMNTSTKTSLPSQVVCNSCGTTYREFKESGLLGCSECYDTFKNTVIPILKRVQSNIEHHGKIPVKGGREIMAKKELEKLKEELQRAIALEEYEKAAELRDKIRNFGQRG